MSADNRIVAQRLLTTIDEVIKTWGKWGAQVDTERETDQVLKVIVDHDLVLQVRVSIVATGRCGFGVPYSQPCEQCAARSEAIGARYRHKSGGRPPARRGTTTAHDVTKKEPT